MPYLTPDSIPEGADCRTLLIPASTDWLAIVSGALTELVQKYNWQQFGAVTVDEAVAAMQTMIDQYYEGCQSCVLPGNTPLFRLNRNGEIEQLVDGEWVPPEGDYELPPTPPRTEPTVVERKCLAAVNAAAVLEQLYEEISDAFQEGMTYQQWTEFLVATLIGLLGTIFGLVIAPLIAIGVLIVGVIYETLEFITADVWTVEFTDMLVCLLYECASSGEDDVVHFDYTCFLDKLASVTDVFDPTFAEIRLFGQISFILQILGSQSLDAMGATTGEDEGDCDDCGWCVQYDFREGAHGFAALGTTPIGVLVSGVGWQTTLTDEDSGVYNARDIAIARDFTGITADQVVVGLRNAVAGSFTGAPPDAWTAGLYNGAALKNGLSEPVGDFELSWDGSTPLELLQVFARMGYALIPADPGGEITLVYVTIRGHGEKPTGGEDC